MRRMAKYASIILILAIAAQCGFAGGAYAANPPQPAPEKLRIEAIHNTPPDDVQPPIGYNEYDKFYADLKWNPLANPNPNVAQNKYINIYLQEITKPYKPSKPLELRESEKGISGGETSFRLKNLNSGTIYFAYARAYYTYTEGMTTYTSPESLPSNAVKFLTDIEIEAYSCGSRQIKIIWDDVWNVGKRIDYKLYISESKDFSNTPPIYITPGMIGASGPVKVNDTAGKLEYVHTVRDPGRVYYIKIAPDISDPELKKSKESKTLAVSSYILAKTTKMFATDFGVIWKIEWTPVITGMGDSGIKISYQIYRGNLKTGGLPQYMAAVDDTTFFATMEEGDNESYFIIRAIVTKNGEDVYPGIKIESDRIFVKESEVPSNPPMPELVDEFSNAGNVIISYKDELKPNGATLLWRAPRKGSGEIDAETVYDIWLINNPAMLDNPPESAKIASSLGMAEANKVMSGSLLLGYKYVLRNLTPNSTYYFKIVAKKTYVEYVDNMLQSVTYRSQPAIRVVITPAEGPIDQPLAPGRPPLRVKKSPPPESRDMVTPTTAVIQLKNKWYEEFNEDVKRWEYRTPEQLGEDIVGDIEAGAEDPLRYRKVVYDSGVTIDVGCVELKEGMNYESLAGIPANKVISHPVKANDPYEDPALNPDGLRHNVDIVLTGLEPNKNYVVWVRAARLGIGLASGPSDPIIVTTAPDIKPPLEKPTVPVFNYFFAGDTYVDLGWNFRPGYNYYIKYGTVDRPDSAKGAATVTPADMMYSNYYRISGLKPDTLYYFWIQAEAVNQAGQTSLSDLSDSCLVKTLPYAPPGTPRGFGVKNAAGAVAKNSIAYEWIGEEGAEYILEVASGIDYKDAREYKAGNATEFIVDGLLSNKRYYARLYAYDPVKKLRSKPTQSISVRTLRSRDDYDSDQDVENAAAGDYIVKNPVVAGKTWKISITGINADRFIEIVKNDSKLDFTLDLTSPPADAEKISLVVSYKVFESLAALKESFIVANPANKLVFRPGTLAADNAAASGIDAKKSDMEIIIDLKPNADIKNSDNILLKTRATGIAANILPGGKNPVPVYSFARPLKIIYEYDSAGWYKEGLTSGYVYDGGKSSWERKAAAARFDRDSGKGYLSFETLIAGHIAVGEPGGNYFDDIKSHWAGSSIAKVAAAHRLKSVSGRKFEPERYATVGEAVKFILDIMDCEYGSNYMNMASAAGIINKGAAENAQRECLREELIAMAVRAYELKTREKAIPSGYGAHIFEDMDKVGGIYLQRIIFAAENGIITSRFKNILGPGDPVTRGEVMALLEKVLALAGE